MKASAISQPGDSMDITILGGAGYIGSVLAIRALQFGHRVTIIDNFRYDHAPSQFHLAAWPRCQIYNEDVRNIQAISKHVAKADAVIPLAAIVGAPACESASVSATSTNHESIKRLLQLLSPQQRVVFPNTNSGYGSVSEGLCTEETPLNPISLYGRTKQAAEDAIMGHPRATTLRLATVFGISPRMRLDLLVNHLVYEAVTSHKIEVFDVGLRRNYVHVKDVAEAFMYCLFSLPTEGEIFNLGNDAENKTKGELAQMIANHTGAQLVTTDGQDPDRRDYEVSSAKLARIGFVARHSLAYGIQELIGYFNLLPANHIERRRVIEKMNTTCCSL